MTTTRERRRTIPARVAQLEAELLGPGGAFETCEADVLGERMRVFVNRPRSLRELVAASAGFGDTEYVVFSDGVTERRVTFAEHARAVASVAAALHDRFGVGRGDRVAILAANCPEWIVTFWATVSLGAIAVGVNGWWSGPEIEFALADCEPKVLVADRPRLDRLGACDVRVPVVEIESGFDALWHHDLSAGPPDGPIAEDDPALILYTSGTTGPPRGVVTTHRNVLALVGIYFFHGLRVMMLDPPEPGDAPTCQLVTSPLFHVSGLHNGAIALLAGGVKSVWPTRLDPAVVLGLIERERVTGWGFTETVLKRVVNHPSVGEYDLSSLRNGGGGGSPFTPEVLARVREVFPRIRPSLAVGYGLTESSALVSMNFGDELLDDPLSVGRPLPTVEVRIAGPGDRPVRAGGEGEIQVRGPMVMLEFWRRPEETAAAFCDGKWLRTGDLGRLRDGRIYVTGRLRDLILRGGENVYPIEIERRIDAHPAVAEVAVVGTPHPELGQDVKAIVVLHPGWTTGPDELAAWTAEALASFKVPTQWEIRETPLPRTATDKILKLRLLGS